MFSFAEELKWYEPGLETVEDSLSGDEQKDLVELIQLLLKTRSGALAEDILSGKNEDEGTQLAIEDALAGPEKEAEQVPETEEEQETVPAEAEELPL